MQKIPRRYRPNTLYRLRFIVAVVFIFFWHYGEAQPKDTLVFFNQTRVIGELKGIQLGFIQFDADDIALIKVKNNKVRTIIAQSHYFRVETTDRRQLQGYLLNGLEPGTITLRTPTGDVQLDLENVTSLVNYAKSWKSRFSGNLNAGYTYTKSSKLGRLNIDGTVLYNAARAELTLSGNSILSADSIETKREREDLSIGVNYSFTALWFAGGMMRYERNLELGLQRRWQQLLGAGRKLIVRKNQQGFMLLGLATSQERNVEDVTTENTEVVLSAYYTLYSFEKPKLTLTATETGYFSLIQKDRVRYDGDINLSWEFIDDFTVNLQFYNNYDSQSPGTGEPNVDVGFVIGLGLKF